MGGRENSAARPSHLPATHRRQAAAPVTRRFIRARTIYIMLTGMRALVIPHEVEVTRMRSDFVNRMMRLPVRVLPTTEVEH